MKGQELPAGSLRRLAQREAADAAAPFLSSGDPEDFHAALREHGTIVFSVPDAMTKLAEWVSIVRGARLLGREVENLPAVKRARRGLEGIGKALVAPRRGRPPLREPDPGAIAGDYEIVLAAVCAFRKRWRLSHATARARRKWYSLAPDERSASLRGAGFPAELVKRLEGFDHQAVDLFRMQPRDSALKLVPLWRGVSCSRVRQAISRRRHPKSGRKS